MEMQSSSEVGALGYVSNGMPFKSDTHLTEDSCEFSGISGELRAVLHGRCIETFSDEILDKHPEKVLRLFQMGNGLKTDGRVTRVNDDMIYIHDGVEALIPTGVIPKGETKEIKYSLAGPRYVKHGIDPRKDLSEYLNN